MMHLKTGRLLNYAYVIYISVSTLYVMIPTDVEAVPCPEYESNIKHLRKKRDFKESCTSPNFTVLYIPDSTKKLISFAFEPFPEYKNCFSNYEINLIKLSRYDIVIACFSVTLHDEGSANVTFRSLNSGIYQVELVPCYTDTCENYGFVSEKITISDIVQSASTSLFKPSVISPNAVIAIATLSVILLLISVGTFLCIKRKSGNHLKASYKNVEKGELSCEEDDASKKHIQVLILYSHDYETKKKVRMLKDFLELCLNFNVILPDDEVSEILINPNHWLEHMLQYKCSNVGDFCDSDKRIIIVESDTDIFCDNFDADSAEEFEDSVCFNALNILKHNWTRSLKDYCHLFVIHFADGVSDSSLSEAQIVPKVRYSIPDHLVDLCLNLSFSRESRNAEISKKIEEHLKSHPIRNLDVKT
ncbi:uncharacterized protein LOC118201281 isoform X2 [Stegodyphus dumicola]|uniref:uncharacterized protein LOC118201281 isoform X2 n=1 Tax=Stegodyphus dumicola TaxID=202533 RepID=UPI0015A91C03|nr:uncharacterized protein LOC118201281 isoform X2 [Stegodyphus dumicola]